VTAANGRRSLWCRLFGHDIVDDRTYEMHRDYGKRWYSWCTRCGFRKYEVGS
jgi:hypothetical protein